MRILLINQAFHPDVAATAQQLTDFAVWLARKGEDVTVLTSRRGYTPPHPLYPAEENYQGVRVVRVCSAALGRRLKVLRILDAILVNLAFARRLLWMPRFDKVAVLTSPPFAAAAAFFFARWRKSEFIYWIMDLNPDAAIAAGWIRKGSFAARTLESVLRFIVRRADKMVVLDRFMKNRVTARGADPRKIEVVSPWSHDGDLETVPHEANPFRQRHGLQERFVVMYSGNHGVGHPFETLLQAALFLKEDPSIVFVFVGGGERVSEITAFKEKEKLPNVLQLPYEERSGLKYSLSAADLHVAVMDDAFVGIIHPCKIYGLLQIGRPFVFVGPEESPIGEIVTGFGVGHRINHGDSRGLVQIIRMLQTLGDGEKEEMERKEKKAAGEYSQELLSQRLFNFVQTPSNSPLTGGGEFDNFSRGKAEKGIE